MVLWVFCMVMGEMQLRRSIYGSFALRVDDMREGRGIDSGLRSFVDGGGDRQI
jgi:hypothetical protein